MGKNLGKPRAGGLAGRGYDGMVMECMKRFQAGDRVSDILRGKIGTAR